MPADAELSNILSRRQRINEDLEEGKEVKKQYKFVNVYTEFHELSRREIKQYEQTFNRYVYILLFFVNCCLILDILLIKNMHCVNHCQVNQTSKNYAINIHGIREKKSETKKNYF